MKQNHQQTPVDTSDQPVYALTKQIQWKYPLEFESYFSLFGGLHIEQSMLAGELIISSRLPAILEICGLSIIGTDAALNINHIKRASYYLQVSLSVIYKKLREAHINSASTIPVMKRLEDRSNEWDMCFYWKLILNIQLEILIFVRSNFLLYIERLRAFINKKNVQKVILHFKKPSMSFRRCRLIRCKSRIVHI